MRGRSGCVPRISGGRPVGPALRITGAATGARPPNAAVRFGVTSGCATTCILAICSGGTRTMPRVTGWPLRKVSVETAVTAFLFT